MDTGKDMNRGSARRSPIRVGVVGVGWGTVVHAPAFRLVDGYELVAICARRPETLAKAQEKLGITDGSTDWRSFVQRDDLDLISIATPVKLHQEVTLAAIAAGKHVLCEKPTALTPGAALAMAEAAERAGIGRPLRGMRSDSGCGASPASLTRPTRKSTSAPRPPVACNVPSLPKISSR